MELYQSRLEEMHEEVGSYTATDAAVDFNRYLLGLSTDDLLELRYTDRRRVQLSLTNEGAELMENLFNNTRQWMVEKLTVLNEEELEAILTAGDALNRAFTE